MGTTTAVRTRLRRRAALAAVGALSATGFVRAALAAVLSPAAATRWSVVAGAVVCLELAYLAVNLDRNRPVGASAVRPRLGGANLVTLARGILLAWLAGFAVVEWLGGPLTAVPVALYAGNVALDGVDGALARRRGYVSALGARLDAEFDGIGVLVGVGVAVAADLLPAAFLLVGVVKYAYLAAGWLVRRRGRALGPLPSRASRRPLAALQMLVVTAVLSTLLVPGAATLVAGAGGLAYGAGVARDWRLRLRRTDQRVDLVG
ncbi:MAG: CDP-alcohol phosphatidyltransferase family protein [Haloferacaceae archaeon]